MPTASYHFGRILQRVGLIALPAAIAAELAGKVTLGQSLCIALGGALLFMYGSRMVPDQS